MPFVPSIGFAGLGQQTRAAQTVYARAARGGRRVGAVRASGRRKKAKKNGVRRARRASATVRKARRGAKRFAKGSAAAKRHMAKLRAMRKR